MGTSWEWWALFIICWLAFGVVGALIAEAKSRPPIMGLALGVLLGIFGVVIIAALPRDMPKAPEGWYPLQCPRCNIIQNIQYGEDDFTCWQCQWKDSADRLLGGQPVVDDA